MRFSKQYKTFTQWKKGKDNSVYVRRIIKLHELNKGLSLNELRNAKLIDYDISKFSWRKLNASQRYNRNLAFKVLRNMRKGESLKETSQRYGINIKIVRNHLGSSIYKYNKKWTAKRNDSLEREMLIYEDNIGKVMVIINKFKYARLIGQYFATIRSALANGDDSKLKKFINKPVIDSSDEKHYLETNLDNIYEYEEQIENSEFFEIYGD